MSLLPLLLSLPTLAQAPAEPAPAADPAAQAAPAEAPAAEAPAAEAPAAGPRQEVRETYNSAGKLVRQLTLVDGRLVQESTYTYDANGLLTEQKTVEGASTTLLSQTWNADKTLATSKTTVDGGHISAATYTYTDGKLTHLEKVEGEVGFYTDWTYNDRGEIVQVVTTTADGTIVDRQIADREPPPPAKTPVTLTISGGVATNTDVETTSINSAFAIKRKPAADQYGSDHLEVAATGSLVYGISGGETTNNDLNLGFGLDYNEFVPRTSAFLFTAMERNPVANLDVDLEVAPIGLKYDLVPEGGAFWMDASFAPIWNFRSITMLAGDTCDDEVLVADGHCTYNLVRGSFRVRAGLELGPAKLKDTLEYLPTLNPGDAGMAYGFTDGAIVRNTAAVSVKLTGRLSLSESLIYTRDMLLKEQVDCAANPDNMLCTGQSLQTTTALTLDMSF